MRKLCPNCEELLKPTSNPEVGECSGCGWSGHYWRAAREPALPADTPKMPYVSIDIETTGLDPETCQTLEIGAVFDNWTLPLDKLPRFHCYVVHEQIVGQPFALALNADILRKLANPQKTEDFLPPSEVADAMATWLGRCGWDVSKVVTPAGKNFASFDRQFLKRLPNFENKVRLHHRTLDPAMLFWLRVDAKLPDSKTCYERAGMDPKVAHTALEDALAVVQLVRTGVKRLKPC